MSRQEYEIEIKSLLGSEEAAEALKKSLRGIDPSLAPISSYTQLNHYFEGGTPETLAAKIAPHLGAEDADKLQRIAREGKNVSVRTREMNGEARIVMKASIGDDTSSNGVMRMELEASVEGFTLDALDGEVLASGYHYQAKWSRTREEYKINDIAVCLDKNAGYGYLAEFEKVIDDPSRAEDTKQELASFMNAIGIAELPQGRLERMFAYYNEHWPEYYGTDKIFIIE
ncbi:MAG: hypothetical protein P4M11_07545 [Candidatus Pacebacteria bacterium]|nr:hypothetical protein [Candidatus Paceibacterota bacterium]